MPNTTSKSFVALFMGSDSDLPVMQAALDVLKDLGIPAEAHIASAHRSPEYTVNCVRAAEQRGCAVFIAGAGMAAHLAGTVAAHTTRPVIGVPLDAGLMGGLDALLATVQMPPGIPVACVAVGKAGARNAAFLAAQVMALADPELSRRVQARRKQATALVIDKDKALQKRLQS